MREKIKLNVSKLSAQNKFLRNIQFCSNFKIKKDRLKDMPIKM